MRPALFRRLSLWALSLVAFAFAAFLVGLGLLIAYRVTSPASREASIEAARPWLFLWRLVLFGSLIAFWSPFCQRVGRSGHLTAIERQRLFSARWTVALWLLILELLLGQNVVGKFIHLWVSSP